MSAIQSFERLFSTCPNLHSDRELRLSSLFVDFQVARQELLEIGEIVPYSEQSWGFADWHASVGENTDALISLMMRKYGPETEYYPYVSELEGMGLHPVADFVITAATDSAHSIINPYVSVSNGLGVVEYIFTAEEQIVQVINAQSLNVLDEEQHRLFLIVVDCSMWLPID